MAVLLMLSVLSILAKLPGLFRLPRLPIQPDSPTNPRHFGIPVSGQSRPGGQHCDQGQIYDPQRWLFIMQHMFDPALQSAVPKCQGADWEPFSGGEPQQGGRVIGPDIPANVSQNCLITGYFHIPSGQIKGQPDQWIKPVYNHSQPRQGPETGIQPSNVGPLMKQDVLPLFFGKVRGQKDSGPEQSQHKGGGNVIGQPDLSLPRKGS